MRQLLYLVIHHYDGFFKFFPSQVRQLTCIFPRIFLPTCLRVFPYSSTHPYIVVTFGDIFIESYILNFSFLSLLFSSFIGH